MHLATDTLGNLAALTVSAADEHDRNYVEELSEQTQIATGNTVERAYVGQGYTGERLAAAQRPGIELEVVRIEGVKGGFVLRPKRWVIERTYTQAARFRRLDRDDERLEKILAGTHCVAFTLRLAQRLLPTCPEVPNTLVCYVLQPNRRTRPPDRPPLSQCGAFVDPITLRQISPDDPP